MNMGVFAVLLVLLAATLAVPQAPAPAAVPPGVREIEAPLPLEISGVAAIPGGYVVVGDSTDDHARIWPEGGQWWYPDFVPDAEGVDVGFSPDEDTLWIVLSEDQARVLDDKGAGFTLPAAYREVCGRGLEGLAVRWNAEEYEVAVAWEGGFYAPPGADTDCEAKRGQWRNPRVALIDWTPAEGAISIKKEFELQVPQPSVEERFRAAALVWEGEALLVLLRSQNADDNRFLYHWLQRFDLEGKPAGEPVKLEELWGDYAQGKNWEALDWTVDATGLVMGFDAASGRQFLVVFPWPYSSPSSPPSPVSPQAPAGENPPPGAFK